MNGSTKIFFAQLILLIGMAAAAIGTAESGYHENRSDRADEAPVLSPEEALETFSVPPGFRVEIVAAEPHIQAPVAMDVDPDGRIWVVEMQSFMQDLMDGESDLEPISRVVVLEDDDGDGRMDRSTVFMDSLALPRSVLVLNDGVLVAEPPNLWFARDIDGDLKADERINITDDYGDPALNEEAMANGLTWGMDNWIHSTHYPGRLRHTDSTWRHEPTLELGQWGLSMDDYGRFYRTWNATPLRATLLDARYYMRNPNMVKVRGSLERIAREAREVWPGHATPGVNRGYQESFLRVDGSLTVFTAASAPTVYRGELYPPTFRGDVFVPEPTGNLVRRFVVDAQEDGSLKAANAYDRTEFLTSTDERFRPVNGYSAPDGTLYFVDMYRGVISLRNFITPYLHDQILDRGLHKHLELGRIYRVVYEPRPPSRAMPKLNSKSNDELVDLLSHANGWWRDTAQQLLIERRAVETADSLRVLADSSKDARTRLHALWTMEGLDLLDRETVGRALSDEAPPVRAAAVRLLEPWLRRGDTAALLEAVRLAGDPTSTVRLQLAASLGEVPPPNGDPGWMALLSRAGTQAYLVDMVVAGLKERELSFMLNLLQEEHRRDQEAGYAEALNVLSTTIVNGGDSLQIRGMFQLLDDRAGLLQWQRLAILDGVEALVPESDDEFERPLELEFDPVHLAQATRSRDPIVREKAELLNEWIVWPGKEGYTPSESPLRTAEHREQFEKGRKLYRQTCAACHQDDGKGQDGVAPSLVGSEWINDEEAPGFDQWGLSIVRIILGGKQGDEMAMPPVGSQLSDEEIAAVVTYVRNAWGNKGEPMTASAVEDTRKSGAARDRPWTEEELRILVH